MSSYKDKPKGEFKGTHSIQRQKMNTRTSYQYNRLSPSYSLTFSLNLNFTPSLASNNWNCTRPEYQPA